METSLIESLSGLIDYILTQQIISLNGFKLWDRTQQRQLKVAGLKRIYMEMKRRVIQGIYLMKDDSDFSTFIGFLSEELHIPIKILEDRMAKIQELPKDDFDNRFVFIQILGAIRKYWQEQAHDQVLDQIYQLVIRRVDGLKIDRPEILDILASNFNVEFSLFINLYEIKLWGRAINVPFKVRSARLKLLNCLTWQVVNTILTKM